MDERKDAGAHDGEQRHRLGRAIDRRTPFLQEKKQDGGNQRASVPDSDPEDKVGDVKRPADGSVQTPGADTGGNLVGDGDKAKQERCRRNAESAPPQLRGLAIQRIAYVIRHLGKALAAENKRLVR